MILYIDFNNFIFFLLHRNIDYIYDYEFCNDLKITQQ